MKKLIKSFLMAVIACACLSLASCSKSADQIAKEAEELITADGSIAPENIDKALDLYEAAADKMKSLEDQCEEAATEIDLDNPAVQEALKIIAVGVVLQSGLSNSELTPEQQARMEEIDKKAE
ncbi:MAG: hypothetical protein ACI4SO_06125 [Muribaculaceae bacterium]